MELFNNAKMSEKTDQEYREMAKYMMNSVDYQNAKPLCGLTDQEQILLRADRSLMSGLSPKDLAFVELEALVECYGKEWYKRYDLTPEEAGLPAPIKKQLVKPLSKLELRKRKK